MSLLSPTNVTNPSDRIYPSGTLGVQRVGNAVPSNEDCIPNESTKQQKPLSVLIGLAFAFSFTSFAVFECFRFLFD